MATLLPDRELYDCLETGGSQSTASKTEFTYMHNKGQSTGQLLRHSVSLEMRGKHQSTGWVINFMASYKTCKVGMVAHTYVSTWNTEAGALL